MSRGLRVLIVEDSEEDAFLLLRVLKKGGFEPESVRVQTADQMRAALACGGWQIVLSDFALPDFDGLSALAVLKETGQDIPFFIVSGTIGEDVAVSAMRSGASDYIMKDRLARLPPAIARELEEAEVRRQRRCAQEEMLRLSAFNESIVQGVAEAILVEDPDGRLTFANPAAERLLGSSRAGLQGRSWESILPEDRREQARHERAGLDRAAPVRFETAVLAAGGQAVPVIASAHVMIEQERRVGVLTAFTDISERVRAELSLRALNRAALAVARAITQEQILEAVTAELRAIDLHCTILLLDPQRREFRIRYTTYPVNMLHAAEAIAGVSAEALSIPVGVIGGAWSELLGSRSLLAEGGASLVKELLPGIDAATAERFARDFLIERSILAPLEMDGSVFGLLVVAAEALRETDLSTVTAFGNQIAAAWQKAELLQTLQHNLDELKRTQDQLVQAQKMEAIGRLAGGIAHDFNNYLTAISGYAEILLADIPAGDPHHEEVAEIAKAAEHSAALTRQLLSFSRKQITRPCNVDLNGLIDGLRPMLGRLIGEDVEMASDLAAGLGRVRVDPGQIHQVIMNLAVNARDAMPEGGRLTVATANVLLDRPLEYRRITVAPGRYVTLRVSDTGAGMSDEVMEHLFEPFFTTKGQGKGTGLGLATVYGIVSQTGGCITVSSAMNAGTTFTIYFPRVEAEAGEITADVTTAAPGRGTETILVVEDEAAVRSFAVGVLRRAGYTVVEAPDTEEAVETAARHVGTIDLVLTDMVTPGRLSSDEMAGCIRARRPGVRVLCMSGYSDWAAEGASIPQPRPAVLNKPFTVSALLEAVRGALATPSVDPQGERTGG
jgi:PAS domain S-box-containing protein